MAQIYLAVSCVIHITDSNGKHESTSSVIVAIPAIMNVLAGVEDTKHVSIW